MGIELRSYQSEAIQKTRIAVASDLGGRRKSVLLVSPTGSGKTTIGAEFARLAVERSRRVLWLAHRAELVEQAADAILRGGSKVSVVSASSIRSETADGQVTVASLETLLARDLRPPADLVILDEAHHGAAPTYRQILDHYRDATLIGLTATPERSDGAGLGGDLFSRLIVVTTPQQCLADGHLVPMQIIRPARQLRPGQIAHRPVDAWVQHARGRQTIVFCQSVEHARDTAMQFGSEGVIASYVFGDTSVGGRKAAISDYRSGGTRVLCNVAVLTEGTDLPNTSCIIVARGAGTPGLWMQMTGRGSRPAPGKQDCIVFDLRGVSHEHGHPYADRTYSLEGRGIASLHADPLASYCRVCGAIATPGDPCAECGVEARARDVRVTGARLEPYQWNAPAAIRAEGDEQRAVRLRRWIGEARERGYNRRWPFVRYRVVFGETPTREVLGLVK